jgi:hypothetical protein
VPTRITAVQPHSAISPEADRLLDTLASGDFRQFTASMTPPLRAQVGITDLEVAAEHLTDTFGQPLGIMEERTHTEGDLLWYSGLVAYAKPGEDGTDVIAVVLIQFALASDRRFARLLVREHWFIDNLEAPADRYMPITRFHPPFEGTFTISHGGPTRRTNYHHGSRGQRFAYDIVVKKDGRARRPGAPKARNSSFYCYGRPLLAPAAGVVVRAINNVPENRPGQRGTAGGNGLIIDHGFGEYSSLWHAIPGSVRVKVGDYVKTGQQVGLVGNSGRSTGPHIHMHAHTDPKNPRAIGLPAPFVDVYVAGRWHDRSMPVRDAEVRGGLASQRRQARGPRIFVDL